jgi:hypothetical protein
MIIHRKIATTPLENGSSARRMLERFYVQNCFENHLKSISRPDGTYHRSLPNYKYHVMSQVVDYVDGLFTLPQLYCIFTASEHEIGGWIYDYTLFNDFKSQAIKYIDKVAEDENDLDEIENFKKNVLELNPIVFTVLNDLFYESGMFDNDYWEGYRYPKISEDENECSIELKELIQTDAAIEKIEDICKNYYHIDDRLAALKNEGYEVKSCWVGSGGVNSTFYLYNKKEIRIQIAASKFKGNGSSKSKSALCAVIPYPTFLHKNRIKIYD